MDERKYYQLKKRLLLAITAIFLLLIFIVNFLEYHKAKNEMENKITLKNSFVEQVYDNIITSYEKRLYQRAVEIVDQEQIEQNFKNKNRQKLKALSYPIFLKLQKEIDGLSIMHFHLPKGDSFLRLHALDNYGDSLWDIRDMIRKVHLDKKQTVGFEMGKYDDSFLTYRVAIPVFDSKKRYLGAFELGVNAQTIIEDIKEIFKEIDATAAFYIQKDKLKHSLTLPEVQNSSAYVLASKDGEFLHQPFNSAKAFEDHRMEKEDKSYQFIIYDQLVKNHMDRSIGVFVLQYDITSEMKEYKNYLAFLVLLSIFLMIIVIYVVNYGFNYYLQAIQNEHRRFENEHQKAQLILDSQSNLVVLVNKSVPVLANSAFLNFFEVQSIEEFNRLFNSLAELFEDKEGYFSIDRNKKVKDWIKTLKSLPLQNRKVAINNKDESETIFEIEISQYKGEEDLYVLNFDDITRIMHTQNELSQRVYKDSLTGIYNRRYYDKVIDSILQNVKRGVNYSVMLFDIDRFKDVNDTYGHNFGDEVLQYISKTVLKSLRSEDIFIRWGGEEFVVIIQNSSLQEGVVVAQKLRKLIKYNKIGKIYVTCSFGVTQIQSDDSKDSVIQRADKAMYTAKKEGRDRVVED